MRRAPGDVATLKTPEKGIATATSIYAMETARMNFRYNGMRDRV